MNKDVLTVDMLRRAFTFKGFPQKYYYPIHPAMWDSFLRIGYTEKQLKDMGFLKTDYLETT